MNAELAGGLLATGVGLAGYVVGLFVVYPARAFSLTLFMLGLTLLALGRVGGDEGS